MSTQTPISASPGQPKLDTPLEVYYYVYSEVYKMRTNILLDDELMNEAFKYSQVKTKKELIREALKEYVENHRRLDMRQLQGKISFKENYDYKKLRGRQ